MSSGGRIAICYPKINAEDRRMENLSESLLKRIEEQENKTKIEGVMKLDDVPVGSPPGVMYVGGRGGGGGGGMMRGGKRGGGRMVGGGGPPGVPSVHHRILPDPIPLEEAAKIEMQSLPSKTPVSVLQELLSRRGTTPKYELVQVEGAIHEPTFRYRVTVSDVVAMGTGRSKKEAKHAAAKAVLDRLIGNGDGNVVSSSPNPLNETPANSISGLDERMSGNPIGLLQELCMSRRWPPPAYDTEFEEGLPHERQFTIACLVFRHKEIGTGKSKKIAKRLAAHKMWLRLKDQPYENNSLHLGLEDEDEIAAEFGSLKLAKIPNLSSSHSVKVSQFHKNLKSSYGPKLTELQSVVLRDAELNFVQFLQEIAAEQEFEVTFVDIEEKSHTGKYQCLVQLSTLPVAVCHGSGNSSKEAQTAAAHNALQYLKIMTKK